MNVDAGKDGSRPQWLLQDDYAVGNGDRILVVVCSKMTVLLQK